jgi:thymidine kinase
MGKIKLIIGCMFSGKTTELIKECNRLESIHKNYICINSKKDTRYDKDDKVSSHDRIQIKCIRVETLSDVDNSYIISNDVILINEGQFFPDIVEYTTKWCEIFNKDIVVSGLDGTFMRKPFGHLLELIPLAESVTKLSAYCSICKDGTEAYFSYRKLKDPNEILIGSSDAYIAVCRKHYLELSKNDNK